MKKIITSALVLVMMALIALPEIHRVQAEIVPPVNGPFPDVSGNHVNAEAIQFLKDQGIVEGILDKYTQKIMYRPSYSINRAEFIKIVIGTLTKTPQGSKCFKDVKDVKEQWFAPYVCDAKTRGLIKGYEDGTFRAMNKITFAEAAKILALAFKLEGEKGTEWHQEYVTALEKKNAIPFSMSTFTQKVTRADMAEMIYRLKANIQTKLSRTYHELSGNGELLKVNSCSAFLERMKETSRYFYPSYGDSYISPMSTGSGASGENYSSSADYSTTNLQIAGVDESDIIKNDGKYIYMVKENTVRMIEAYPAEKLQEITTFVFDGENTKFQPQKMYLGENTLTIIGRIVHKITDKDEKSSSFARTKIFVLDVTDPLKPHLKRSVEFDGTYFDSRKIDSTLYLLMNQKIVDSLPKMIDSMTDKEVDVSCDNIFFAPGTSNTNFTLAAAISLNDTSKNINLTAISKNSSGKLYVSKKNLYIATVNNSNLNTSLYKFELDQGSIHYKTKSEVTGSVLNQFSMDEYNGYLRIATTNRASSIRTNNVYIFNNDMEVVGKVEAIAPGENIASIRFMEDRAYLSTSKKIDPFFVLDLKDPLNPKLMGRLKIPGSSNYFEPYDENNLLGFGLETEIVSTFANPRGGEPITQTATKGMKLNMINVTDINNPKETFKEIIGNKGTTSDVLRNPKALLLDKEKNLLAFPVVLFEEQEAGICSKSTYSTCPSTCVKVCMPSDCTIENGVQVCKPGCDGLNSCQEKTTSNPQLVFTGAYIYVYNVDPKSGFQLREKITHFDAGEIEKIVANKEGSSLSSSTILLKMIQRAFYIGENLYTVSPSMIKANKLDDLKELKSLQLTGNSTSK